MKNEVFRSQMIYPFLIQTPDNQPREKTFEQEDYQMYLPNSHLQQQIAPDF